MSKLPADLPVNSKKQLTDMMVQWGFPVKHKESKPQGYWVPYAWAVRLTVENMGGGRIVSKAVRMILRRAGIPVTKENEESLRVRYHAVCKQPWPPEMEGLVKRREKVKGFFDEPAPEVTAPEVPEPARLTPRRVGGRLDAGRFTQSPIAGRLRTPKTPEPEPTKTNAQTITTTTPDAATESIPSAPTTSVPTTQRPDLGEIPQSGSGQMQPRGAAIPEGNRQSGGGGTPTTDGSGVGELVTGQPVGSPDGGMTTREIAQALNADGIKTRSGGEWRHSVVAAVVKRGGEA